MAQLICYGHCNPHRKYVDALVAAARNARTSVKHPDPDRVAPLADGIEALRGLRHTPHVFQRYAENADPRHVSHIWTCVVCGASRMWGMS